MPTRYRFDPARSQFTVQAFAAGMLSFLGHSPTFAVRDFSGDVTFEGGRASGMGLQLAVRADSLQLVDAVSDSDRRDIEGTMRRDVLATAGNPRITYEAAKVAADVVAPGRYRLRVGGRLALRGVTRPLPVDAELLVFDDGIRLRGETALRLSDYRIRPVTALGGTIKLQDELKVSFDIAGIPEGT
jgi:polyisoprenoid-binding protein YceI